MERQCYITIVMEKAALKGKGRDEGGEGKKTNLESRDPGDESVEKSQWFHFHLSPQALGNAYSSAYYI